MSTRRLLLSPLLLLVALATILGAGTVSASAAHGPETRVRAIDTAVVDDVGQHSSETPGHVGCLRPSQLGLASGSCVATEAGESWAATRAGELQAQLPGGSQGRVTMGAGVLEDASGNQIRVISTSEPNGYLRPGVTTQPGEIVISGTGHAEADIVAYAEANGYRVVTIGAGRPVCAACATTITGSGGTAATPLKGPK